MLLPLKNGSISAWLCLWIRESGCSSFSKDHYLHHETKDQLTLNIDRLYLQCLKRSTWQKYESISEEFHLEIEEMGIVEGAFYTCAPHKVSARRSSQHEAQDSVEQMCTTVICPFNLLLHSLNSQENVKNFVSSNPIVTENLARLWIHP